MPAARRVGAQRRGIDDAEHRSIMKCVMADDRDPSGKLRPDLGTQTLAQFTLNR